MNYLQSAQALYEQMVRDRRHLHQHPEVGMDLPETCSYVMARLTEMGYQPRRLGGGVTATVTGKPDGKVFLLRADMDALPMREESGLPFASQRSCAHTCGHDMHTAMLLGAAQLLRDRAAELNGTVKFMFQPGEEVLSGARSMIEAGILEDPHVDAAMGAHMIPMIPAGLGGYGTGVVSASSDHLVIRVEGRGGHGAHPQSTVDPINIGVHIHLALQELLSREADPAELVVLTFGKFQGETRPTLSPPLRCWRAPCAPSASRCAPTCWNGSTPSAPAQRRPSGAEPKSPISAPPAPSRSTGILPPPSPRGGSGRD